MSSRAPSILPQLSADTPITQRDRFPPIFRNLPEFSPRDPFGLLPIWRRVQVTESCVLEWCPIEKCLKPWFWPVSGGERVTLSDFPQHRWTYRFRYPCCLCSVHKLDPNHVTESVVFMVTSGNLAGDLIERMYHKRSQPVRVYALRYGSDVPPELSYEGPEDDTVSTPSGFVAPTPVELFSQDL
ncbi:hypothetical protein B0H13DRAFT_2268039 [Mycena leptocephala]|nr:hypothetical protein B0H13DRAFT_2268039 [Mycena leptocephala]